jgi:glycosyltransferase involved in cell wall biosynthesis
VLDLRLVQAVRRLARELKPQAVHAHNYEALAACLLARPGPPVVYHAHTLFGHELPCFFDHPAARALAKALGAGADQFLPPLAAMTLAISPRLVEELLELGHDPQRVGCVLPGIDLPPLAKPLPPLTTGGEKIVGYCGNLDRYQDLETLLDAMVLLCRRRRPVRLALVTASPPERLAEALRSRGLQKQVIFLPHGSFDNALAQLRRLDLCVLPRAIPGGFPIKLLAYLAAERPVISTIAGTAGLPLGDLVEVVNEGDASQLAAAIGHLLDHLDEARKRARRGRAFVEEEFSWDRSAAQLETHLARL